MASRTISPSQLREQASSDPVHGPGIRSKQLLQAKTAPPNLNGGLAQRKSAKESQNGVPQNTSPNDLKMETSERTRRTPRLRASLGTDVPGSQGGTYNPIKEPRMTTAPSAGRHAETSTETVIPNIHDAAKPALNIDGTGSQRRRQTPSLQFKDTMETASAHIDKPNRPPK